MSARSKARKRALDVLFAAEARSVDPLVVLQERMQPPAGPDASTYVPIGDYAEGLVRGVAEHREEIDALLRQYSRGWALERMPAVDRTILRIAVHELMHRPDVPPAVAVDEAVHAAGRLSTDDSPKFVNAVLDRIMHLESERRGA